MIPLLATSSSMLEVAIKRSAGLLVNRTEEFC